MRQKRPSDRIRRGYFSLCAIALAAILATLLSSCSEQQGEPDPRQTRLSWLGSMYGRYISQTTGEGPKSIDELRKFVAAKTTPEHLARLGVANAEELFVSPADGKPFVMVMYAKRPPPGTGPPLVVFHEAEGRNGQKAVAFLGGGTHVMTDSELSQAITAAGGKEG